ncbi:MAG TPA: hypothetical protein VGM57_00065 [Pseudolabrys sp.]
MQRAHFVSVMALVIAVPAATAASSFLSSDASAAKPCFSAGKAAYEMSHGAADYTVRIDNAAASPSLRMQIVDDPASADFVLIDEDDAVQACKAAASIKTIRIDAAATKPDVTVAMTRGNADYKVFVKSSNFTDEDAAALFAVIWRSARKSGGGLAFATGIGR